MRILLLTTYFRPDITANAVLMTQLAEDLAAIGHQVTVITSMPHYDTNRIWDAYRGRLYVRERWGNLDVRHVYLYVPPRKERLLGRIVSHASFNVLSTLVGVLAGQHDVILAPSPPLTNGIAAYLIGRLYGTPFVYNVQDIYPDIAIRMGIMTSSRVIAFFRAMEQFVYRKAAVVSVISDGFRRNLLAKGVPEDKVHVISNFVDTDFVSPQPRHNRFGAEHGLDDRFVVLFAGNVGLSQGLESVLGAAQLVADLPDVLFLIVGNGAARAGLMAQAEQMQVTNVRFLPFQPHEAVPEMYAATDVGLVPLRRGFTQESMPSKVLTILSAARPLIASVDPGSDTWNFVQDAGCGLCVEPEDASALAGAIRTLYHDRTLGQQMGLRGREYVLSKYNRKAVARQYANMLEGVIRHG